MKDERKPITPLHRRTLLALALLLLLYLGLALYQLGLPGLHYDEAKEAGVNAMELLTGAPVSAFRGAALDLGAWRLPLMVQDYIGASNVYLSLPVLAISGVGVPNLRLVAVLTGLASLLLIERLVSQWVATGDESVRGQPPLSLAGLATVALLAAAPSFVFWSRQGIFVTNLTQPLCWLCLWQGVRWLRGGRARALLISALAGGLAIYAKLLAVWIVGPFVLLGVGWWLWRRPLPLSPALLLGATAAFMLPLLPLLLFNVQTGGTLASVVGNAGQSYYGVDNLDLWGNLRTRLPQLATVLRGDHFWYLGGLYGNAFAPWMAGALLAAGLALRPRRVGPPLLLLTLAVLASLFTVSDLFLTHYALLHPLLIGCVGVAVGAVIDGARSARLRRAVRVAAAFAATCAVALWLALDLAASLRTHDALVHSGGLADHSDASYHLAYALQYGGMGAPIALDWGLDAPVRFLSNGAVTPIEIFGYDSLDAPDADFTARLDGFLDNPDNVYLLRAPGQSVYAGRREAFLTRAESMESMGRTPALEASFAQRDGTPLFELWRVE